MSEREREAKQIARALAGLRRGAWTHHDVVDGREVMVDRTDDMVRLAAAIERLMAERDADEARVTLLEGSLRKAAERLESRGHHFGAERARAALTALPQVPQSTASPDDQEGEKT